MLLCNHEANSLEPRFKGYFRVIAICGNQVHMIPREGGNPRWAHVTDVKYVLPVDAVIDQMPPVSQAGCTVPFTVQPLAYTSCTSRLRASQGSHRMGDQWHQL